jgi:hypothetical protein
MANFIERGRDLLAINAVNDRRAEFELAFETISYLQRVHSKARLDHNNIETVFSAVDLARTLKTLPGIAPEKIDAASNALIWLIVRTLEQTVSFSTEGGTVQGTSDYSRLATLIAELGGRTPALSAAVLTFNYDVGIDFSFSSQGVPFSYYLGDHDSGVPLLKLHGSMNWFRLKENKKIIPYNAKEYRTKFRLRGHFRSDSSPDVFCPVSKQAAEVLCGEYQHGVDLEPVLVPPTWSKGEYHREIGNVWRRAAAELKQARHIFVLGYSLPPTDQFFRLLFALGTEGEAVLRRMSIYDPKPAPVAERFREMMGNAALDVLQVFEMDFGGGLRHIDKVLFENAERRPR